MEGQKFIMNSKWHTTYIYHNFRIGYAFSPALKIGCGGKPRCRSGVSRFRMVLCDLLGLGNLA
jgi:hypothetical protein